MRQKEAEQSSSKREARFIPKKSVLSSTTTTPPDIQSTGRSDTTTAQKNSKLKSTCQMPPIVRGLQSKQSSPVSSLPVDNMPRLQGTDPQQFEAFVRQIEDVTVAVTKKREINSQIRLPKQQDSSSIQPYVPRNRCHHTQVSFHSMQT